MATDTPSIETLVNSIALEGITGSKPLGQAAREIAETVSVTRVSYKEGQKCTIHNHTYTVGLKLRGLNKKDTRTARELAILIGVYAMMQTTGNYDPRVDGIEFHGTTDNGEIISTKHYRKNFDAYRDAVRAKYNV